MERALPTESGDTRCFERMADELRGARKLTPDLIAKVIADTCTRVPNLVRAGKAAAFDRLILAEAWTDAALALIELELPMWRLRRLVYDGGEWVCSLSRHPDVPIEFDEPAEERHESGAVAILLSLIEAKRLLAAAQRVSLPSVPHVRPIAADPFCCDNFR
ncbi:hypothetical protein [Bradyrhizobium sp. DASA03007]|uniref:hypothetical protein n=1 Tax=unclassified Bradyrhizobium TaxID=2631580 RepID=UPI003F717100